MHVISLKKLRVFWTIHADAEGALRAWHSIAEREYWETLNDIRATIRSADQVGECFVFNIAGNKYRLIVRVKRGRVYVRHVLTHAEYDRDVLEKRLLLAGEWTLKNTRKVAAATASAASDTYLKLVQKFPLRPIRSDKQLDRAIEIIDSLLDRRNLDEGEEDYLEVLSDLVHTYEAEEQPIAPASDAELLRFLMEANGVNQVEVAKETGIVDSTISKIVTGERRLNRADIAKLAGYFNVNPSVFLAGEAPTPRADAK